MKVLHPLLDFHKSLAGIGKCQWVQFFSHGGIDTLLFHPYLRIRCHFSDCPSAAICNMATKIYWILMGKFSLYCHITNIHLWHYGPIIIKQELLLLEQSTSVYVHPYASSYVYVLYIAAQSKSKLFLSCYKASKCCGVWLVNFQEHTFKFSLRLCHSYDTCNLCKESFTEWNLNTDAAVTECFKLRCL